MAKLPIEAMNFRLYASSKEASSEEASSKEDWCDLLDGRLKRILLTRGVRGDTKVFKSLSFDFEIFLGELQ